MLFVNIHNSGAFFRQIEKCVGNVAYVDAHGIRRDLKSVAAQLANADFLPERDIPELEVFADRADDRERLLRYMMQTR